MRWSYRIARISGIDVQLHVTFLLLLAFLGWIGYEAGGTGFAIRNVSFVLLLFLCVLLHEFGHALAARRYGIRTPDITLLPIGGVARLERMPENPMQELVIAIAGPMVNVIIALALWIALGLPAHFGDSLIPTESGGGILHDLMRVNVMLVLFNLIPAFPMDGGRMLRALLGMRLSHATATRIAARTGQVIAIAFALVGWFGIPGVYSQNLFLVFIALFVFMGAQQETAFADMRAAVSGLRVADAMTVGFQALPAEMPAAQAAQLAAEETQPVYPITDAHLRPQGMVTRNALLAAAQSGQAVALLAQPVPPVRMDASFDEAFRLMHHSGSAVLPVVNPNGHVIGLVSLNLLSRRVRATRPA